MDQHDPQTEAYMGQLMAAQPRLRTYLRMLIYNPTDVSDLMQEVATPSAGKNSTASTNPAPSTPGSWASPASASSNTSAINKSAPAR